MNKKLISLMILLFLIIVQSPAQAFWPFNSIRLKAPSESSMQEYSQVKGTINNIMIEYESKNIIRLMDYVSRRYVGDYSDLEFALRNEFSDKAFIEMTYYIDKILFDSKNNALVTITYIKRTQDRRTSKIKVKKGRSDVILRKENGKYYLWKMKPRFMG